MNISTNGKEIKKGDFVFMEMTNIAIDGKEIKNGDLVFTEVLLDIGESPTLWPCIFGEPYIWNKNNICNNAKFVYSSISAYKNFNKVVVETPLCLNWIEPYIQEDIIKTWSASEFLMYCIESNLSKTEWSVWVDSIPVLNIFKSLDEAKNWCQKDLEHKVKDFNNA